MVLPLIPLAAVWAPIVKEFLLEFSLILSQLWERSSLAAVTSWAPVVASVLAPELASACSVFSGVYDEALLLVRFIRFAHFVDQTTIVLHPMLQALIGFTVLYGGFVVCTSLPCFLERTVFRFVPRRVRAHPYFWFTQGLQFARCANSIRVALSFEPLYRCILILPLVYLFAVATDDYAEAAYASLFSKICSTLKAVQARRAVKATSAQAPVTTASATPASTIKARVPVPVSHEYDDLLRRAQSCTARRQARKMAKAVRAPTAQVPVAPKTVRRSCAVQAPTPSLLERANACAERRRLRRLAKKT